MHQIFFHPLEFIQHFVQICWQMTLRIEWNLLTVIGTIKVSFYHGIAIQYLKCKLSKTIVRYVEL